MHTHLECMMICEHRSGLSFVHVFPFKFRGENSRGLCYFVPSYLLFSTQLVLFSVCSCTKHLTRAWDHNTIHKTHNNQHDPPPPCPSAALALSLHGNIRHGPKSWHCCSLWANTRLMALVVLSPLLVPLFGAPKRNPSKNRERGGVSSFRWPPFEHTTQQPCHGSIVPFLRSVLTP